MWFATPLRRVAAADLEIAMQCYVNFGSLLCGNLLCVWATATAFTLYVLSSATCITIHTRDQVCFPFTRARSGPVWGSIIRSASGREMCHQNVFLLSSVG